MHQYVTPKEKVMITKSQQVIADHLLWHLGVMHVSLSLNGEFHFLYWSSEMSEEWYSMEKARKVERELDPAPW